MDVQEEALSRKRPRLDDAASDSGDAPEVEDPNTMVQDAPIVRDEEYYRMDGDCVIQVGGVMFKVCHFASSSLNCKVDFLPGASLLAGERLVRVCQYVQHASRRNSSSSSADRRKPPRVARRRRRLSSPLLDHLRAVRDFRRPAFFIRDTYSQFIAQLSIKSKAQSLQLTLPNWCRSS